MCERRAIHNAIKAAAHARNARLISHPRFPIAYSLIILQDGSNSGFIKCKSRSKTINVMVDMTERFPHLEKTS
jgi:hypothetical protein